MIVPLSTGITYQLIPKASVDEIPVHSMGYGRTSAANGKVFEWIFNFPATYWDQAAVFVKYIGEREGGMDASRARKLRWFTTIQRMARNRFELWRKRPKNLVSS